MTAAKRAMSILLSGAMLMGNLISPMTAFAGEAVTEGNEVYEAPVSEAKPEQPVTEAPDFLVTLPYYEEAAFMVDEGHVKKRANQGNTVLTYKAGDDVKITVAMKEGFELEELQVLDTGFNGYGYTWEREDTFAFPMPEKDLKVKAAFRELKQEEETAAGDVMAADGDAEDAPAAEITPESLEAAPSLDAGTAETEEAAIAEEGAGSEEASADKPADSQPQETAGEEGGRINNAENDTSSESKDLQIPAIDPETEADGFPVGGSIVRLAEIGISIEETEFLPESSFEDSVYPQETCRVQMKSNTIQYGVPGLYDVIYRVDESKTGRFWYVVRPVRVLEAAVETQTVSEINDGSDDGNASAEGDEDPSHLSGIGEAEEDITEAAEENAAVSEEELLTESEPEDIQEPESELPVAEDKEPEEEAGSVHNILFDTGEGYTITMDNDQVTYQEGDEVSFTVTAKEKYAIRTASAFVALTGDKTGEDADPVTTDSGSSSKEKDSSAESGENISPVVITPEAVEVSRTNAVTEGNEVVEASFEFEMPAEDVVLMASVTLAAAVSNDVTVTLDNGGIKSIPKAWTPDGMSWANGSTVIGYTRYRTVTMPDGKERRAYCLQPALGAEENGKYTATEVRKKGKISGAEATLLRKGVFYGFGGPGWATGDIKSIFSDCSSNDEYYVATHYMLSKIYCDATSGNWNVATSGGTDYEAVNAKGKKAIEDAVAKLKSLPDPDASLAPTQVAGVYNEATGFAETQAVTFSTNVTNNNLTTTLPAGVYLTVGGTTYEPGQKAQIPQNASFTLKKNGYEAAHQETLNFKAAIFTDFDAYLINVAADRQNMGFSYVADKGFELLVNWPDLLTHLNIVKHDAHTGSTTPTPGYSMDGAVYGIYADAGKTQLLEQLTIVNGSAVSSDNYVIGKTYYVAEISAPAVYQVDPTVYPVMAVAGGTATVTSSDVPKAVKISVQKVDKETGKSVPQAKGLSFEGAVFGIYSDEACSIKAVDMNGNPVADIRTDESGHAETPQALLIGNYYVKELAPPEGYLINETVFPVTADQVRDEIVNQDADASLVCEEQIIKANMDLMKVKTLKGLNTQAAEGVVFTFTYVNDPSVTFSVVDGMNNTVITDAEGYATTASDKHPAGTLIYGEWEITESNTPEGFESLDPTRFMIAGNGRTYRFVANNRQIHAAVLIEKHDANTGSRIPVAGVKFRLFKDGELVKLFNPTTRAYEDTWITDADGMVQLPEMVDYGTYVVKEDPESIPDGYFVMEDTSFTVDEMADDYLKPITLTANEPPQMGNILVEKRDAKTDEVLDGFTFEISAAEDITDPAGVIRTGTDADGNEVSLTAGTVVDRIETGKNGNAVSKDLFLGSYTVRETGIKNGYAITKETQTVTIKGDAAKARNKEKVSEYVLFKNYPTSVKLLKISSRSGAPLAGITFLVHKLQEGESVADYAYTGEEESSDGEINAVNDEGTAENTVGSNDGKEASDEEVSADQTDDSADGDVDDPDLMDDESDIPGNETEEGVNQGSGLDESLINEEELYVTDENGEILVEYLDADSTYVIREIDTIPGYNLSHELVSFSVDSEGLIDGSYLKEVTMENDPNRIHISKVDITNSEEIPGAQLTITDSEGNVVAEWTSTYEVHEIDALPAGTYVLTEVTAPDGYEETESITFTVLNSRKIQKVVMKDSPFREVEISKMDITGDKELVGAHLTITDKDGNEIASWESTADVHTVKLHSGEYVLTETKPADGYVTAESIPFTVIRTSATDYEVMGLAMKDDVTKVKITKTDITDAKPVIGAELVIKDVDGNEVEKWTTTQEPHYIEMLPIGTYTLTEITAPSGYATAETVTFTVEDTGEIQMVEMKDAPITAEISKKDIADGPGGKELPGAHLTVKNEKGEVIDDWVSTKEPHKISMLPVGKYTLTEITAPKGYEVAESITFEITDTGEVHKVTMYDSPKEETVDLTGKKKTTTTGGGYTPSGTPGVTSVVTPPVKTGDDTPILFFALLGLLAVFAGGLAVSLKRKGRIV